MRIRVLACGLAAILIAGPASAQPAAEGTRHDPATPLPGVTVAVPSGPPAVAGTYPASDATVTPGVTVLKVSFDQVMDPEGWSYARGEGGEYPSCLDRPRRLNDGKSFVLLCTTAPGRTYAVALNHDGTGFVGLGRRPAPPFVLRFTTTRAESVRTIKAAMAAAGLKDDESPIQDDRPAPADRPSVSAPPVPVP